MKKLALALLACATALAISPVASAQDAVFNFTQATGGQVQDWTGNLATLFTVNSAVVTVDDLGIYNGSGSASFAGTNSIEVGLYDITTSTQIGSTVTFAPGVSYNQQGYSLFQAIAPVTLTSGDLYEVDAVGFGTGGTPNGNSQGGTYSWTANTLNGALSFPGTTGYGNPAYGNAPALSVFNGSPTLDFPTPANGGVLDGHSYEAGNFEVTVPDGGSSLLYLLLAGVTCVGTMFLCSRNKAGNCAAA